MEAGLGISNPVTRLQLQENQDASFKNDEIKEIYITQNELIAVVTFMSGCISLYDAKNGFSLLGDAVDEDISKLITQSGDTLPVQAKVIEAAPITPEYAVGLAKE